MSTQTTNLNLVKPDGTEVLSAEIINGNYDTIDTEIAKRVQSINGTLPSGTSGSIVLNSVPFADNLNSDNTQSSNGTFVIRTTGGSASISDGESWVVKVLGNRTHTGYVAEELTMTVTPMEREEGVDPITATLNEDTFRSYVATSRTISLTYTFEWTENPALYGITVTGTPVAGDYITVVYVKEERGTIAQSTPTGFKSTGFNLYNHTEGYAYVSKYSDEYGFIISGTYTSLQYSATLSGDRSNISPIGGAFSIPGDGYVWVSGGNDTDTCIIATWSDWTEGHPGEWEAYSETTVTFAGAMASYFPNGLMRVGDIRDEVDLNLNMAYSRVGRMTYSAENLASAVASGREYEYDENYIYIEKETPGAYSIFVDGEYVACDHGMEFFVGTSVAAGVETIYGNNLKNKLERDVLTLSQQTLTDSQKEQVCDNIGIGDIVERFPQIPNSTDHTTFASLPSTQGMYSVVYTGTDSDAPVTTSTAWWWNVIQIGSSTRLTQIAYSPFRNREKIYVRQKHDSVWYGWYAITGTQI